MRSRYLAYVIGAVALVGSAVAIAQPRRHLGRLITVDGDALSARIHGANDRLAQLERQVRFMCQRGGCGPQMFAALTGVRSELNAITQIVNQGSPGHVNQPYPNQPYPNQPYPQQGQVQTMEERPLQEMLRLMKAERSDQRRLAILATFVPRNYFTTRHVRKVTEVMWDENARLEAIRMMAPRVVDGQQYNDELDDQFRQQQQRDEMRRLMRQRYNPAYN